MKKWKVGTVVVAILCIMTGMQVGLSQKAVVKELDAPLIVIRPAMRLFERNNAPVNPPSYFYFYEDVYSSRWIAETFTVGATGLNISFDMTRIRILQSRAPDALFDMTLGIRGTDGDKKPLSSDLYSVTLNSSIVGVGLPYTWVSYNFPATHLLAGHTYAMVYRVPLAPEFYNSAYWLGNHTESYPGGQVFWSDDSGLTWYVPWSPDGIDHIFEVWGN
jgi:hypothetical protein